MIVYMDTSVLLRILFREPSPLPVWGDWERAYSSSLLRVESRRTVDRMRLSGHLTDEEVAALTGEIQLVCDTVALISPDNTILERAADSYPTAVGTLDAIHLATALAVNQSDHLDFFLTHDRQLGLAARSLGFKVVGLD